MEEEVELIQSEEQATRFLTAFNTLTKKKLMNYELNLPLCLEMQRYSGIAQGRLIETFWRDRLLAKQRIGVIVYELQDNIRHHGPAQDVSSIKAFIAEMSRCGDQAFDVALGKRKMPLEGEIDGPGNTV
jgi:hypothetical protein